MSADSDALRTVQSLPGLTAGEQQYFLTVARGEGFYGLGWGNPSAQTIAESLKFGIDPRAGVGSNNWGAEQGSGSAGSFPHIDHHRNGEAYVGNFKRHLSATEGAASAARILLKPNVRAAIARGDLRGAVFAQHDNKYFELDPEQYLKGVKSGYATLTKNLGWPILLGDPPPVTGGVPDSLPLDSGPSESQPPPSSSGALSHRPVLRLGSSDRGDTDGPVHILQQVLNKKHGFTLIPDGEFGILTLRAVREFQCQQGLRIDGIVGPLTWKKLGG